MRVNDVVADRFDCFSFCAETDVERKRTEMTDK